MKGHWEGVKECGEMGTCQDKGFQTLVSDTSESLAVIFWFGSVLVSRKGFMTQDRDPGRVNGETAAQKKAANYELWPEG